MGEGSGSFYQARIEFGHNPEHFEAFKHRYRAELDVNPEAQSLMRSVVANAKETGDMRITLLYAAKDEHCNHAMIYTVTWRSTCQI